MHEFNYYENKDLWKADRYKEEQEQNRFYTCAALIPKQVVSILDVGCGNGEFLYLLEHNHPSLRLAGLERSAAAIRAAVCNTNITMGTVDNLPFPDAAFDLVSAQEVIEHLPYGVYEKALRELSRVARNYILISVPYRETRTYAECPYCACKFNSSYHMRSFDPNTMYGLFPDFHLEESVTVKHEDYILGPFLRNVYRRTVHRKSFPRHALCPQCGFGGDTVAEPTSGTSVVKTRKRLKETLKKRLPKYRRPNWIVVLYKRMETT